MTPRNSAIGLFCEDIRDERLGTTSLVGVLPDNVALPAFPFLFPKIAVYVRFRLDATLPPPALACKLVTVDGTEFILGEYDSEAIAPHFNAAIAAESPIVGFLMNGFFLQLSVPKAGRFVLVAAIDGESFIAGTLNVVATDPVPPAA